VHVAVSDRTERGERRRVCRVRGRDVQG
jgi:hypothetical protein